MRSPLTANSLLVVHVNQGKVTLEGAAMSLRHGVRQSVSPKRSSTWQACATG